MDAKCRWRSDRLDGAVSFRELLGQTKVMQICQRETLNHQGAITQEVCCLAAQYHCTKNGVSLRILHYVYSKRMLISFKGDILGQAFSLNTCELNQVLISYFDTIFWVI